MKINMDGVTTDDMQISEDNRLLIRGETVRWVDLPMTPEEIDVLMLTLIERDGVAQC